MTPTKREQSAAKRIVENGDRGDILVLVPNPRKGESIDRSSFKEFLRPLLHEIDEPLPDVDPRDITPPEKLWRQWNPPD